MGDSRYDYFFNANIFEINKRYNIEVYYAILDFGKRE